PSWPIEMPSLTAIVTNSMGNPSAARTPSLARFASRSSGMLHGVTSFQLDATPICGLSQSASVIPTARSIARAPARAMPAVTPRPRVADPPAHREAVLHALVQARRPHARARARDPRHLGVLARGRAAALRR